MPLPAERGHRQLRHLPPRLRLLLCLLTCRETIACLQAYQYLAQNCGTAIIFGNDLAVEVNIEKKGYRSLELSSRLERRDFLKIGGGSLLGAGLLLGRPPVFGQEAAKVEPPAKPKTNIDQALAVPRTKNSLPGPFPGKVVAILDGRPE